MKKFFVLTVTLVCLLTTAAFAENNVVATYIVVNCRESITLRETPSVGGYELMQIPLGARVRFLGGETNEFYQIEYRGVTDYALKAYLRLD